MLTFSSGVILSKRSTLMTLKPKKLNINDAIKKKNRGNVSKIKNNILNRKFFFHTRSPMENFVRFNNRDVFTCQFSTIPVQNTKKRGTFKNNIKNITPYIQFYLRHILMRKYFLIWKTEILEYVLPYKSSFYNFPSPLIFKDWLFNSIEVETFARFYPCWRLIETVQSHFEFIIENCWK